MTRRRTLTDRAGRPLPSGFYPQEAPMNLFAERAIREVDKYDGHHYETWGANRGPLIDPWEARWGMRGEPWCAIGIAGYLLDAGRDVYNAYGGARLLSPSTAVMCSNARRLGWLWNGRGPVPPGSIWINCGIHVELVTVDLGADAGLLATTGCNVSDGIYDKLRYTQGYTIIVPPAIITKPDPVKAYWLEDMRAKQYVVGQWRMKNARNVNLRRLIHNPAWAGQHPRAQKHGPRSAPYQIIAGGFRHFGPFESPKIRKRAERALEKRLGYQLRPYSTNRKAA